MGVSWNFQSDVNGIIQGVTITQTDPQGNAVSQTFGPGDSVGSTVFRNLKASTTYNYELDAPWQDEFGNQLEETLFCSSTTPAAPHPTPTPTPHPTPTPTPHPTPTPTPHPTPTPTPHPTPTPPPILSGIWLAYVANNSSNDLLVASSPDGLTWTTGEQVGGQSTGLSPAMVIFKDQLVIAYVADNSSRDLLITTSSDGINWSQNKQVTSQQSSSHSPALAVYDKKLVLAYVANNPSNTLLVTTSSDGVNWTAPTTVFSHDVVSSKAAPTLVVANKTLYLIWVVNDSSNDLYLTASNDAVSWYSTAEGGITLGPGAGPQPAWYAIGQQTPHTPGLTSLDGNLAMVYIANNGSNELFLTVGFGPFTWLNAAETAPAGPIPGPQTTSVTPAITSFKGQLVLVFVAMNGSNDLLTMQTTDRIGVAWTQATQVTHQQASKRYPSLCTNTP
jgi:hypothetical protein